MDLMDIWINTYIYIQYMHIKSNHIISYLIYYHYKYKFISTIGIITIIVIIIIIIKRYDIIS